MYRHILIATDGSELSAHGVAAGVELAKQVGAKVTFVTVSEFWSPVEMAENVKLGDLSPVEDFEANAARVAARILGHAADVAAKQGVACDTAHVPDRKPAAGICQTADAMGCDLIVVSSHGRRGWKKLMIGSQAAEVVASAKQPVLVCR